MATQRLSIKKSNPYTYRVHMVTLIVVLLVGVAIGHYAVPGTPTGNTALDPNNCVPPDDLQFFVDQANDYQADWQQCEKDLWALGFSLKQGYSVTPTE